MPPASAPGNPGLAGWRLALRQARAELRAGYGPGSRPGAFLGRHTRAVDQVLRGLWREGAPSAQAALIATGGYGRAELFPGSDVDILLLLPDEPVLCPTPAARSRTLRGSDPPWAGRS